MTSIIPKASYPRGSYMPTVVQAKNVYVAPRGASVPVGVSVLDFETFHILREKPKPAPEPIEVPEDAAEQLPDFMAGHELTFVEGLDDVEYTQDALHEKRDTFKDANLISSRIAGTSRHRPIIDLDFPAMLIPSSTPGHSHLYLDKELTKDQMERLLGVLHEVGIIADGNLNQWERFKAVFLRLPWVKKSEGATEDTPKD